MTLEWHDGRLVARDASEDTELLAADSWLVDDGMVRGLECHESRFARACHVQRQIPLDTTISFLRAARTAIPARGRWFPRVELDAVGVFRLRLRRAPTFPATALLLDQGVPDQRHQPRIKGPDLASLTKLRHEAEAAGAGEALIVTGDGCVAEATLSSVIWWRGDTLCLPPPRLPLLAGVTRALVVRTAANQDVEVRYDVCRVEDIRDCEVWLLSSLRGIWPVAGWVSSSGEAGGDRPVPRVPGRAQAWQRMLESWARPIPG
jgi:branched-subunit amino acid aminotransferase/4-amino-4-deoxychorismate lyase